MTLSERIYISGSKFTRVGVQRSSCFCSDKLTDSLSKICGIWRYVCRKNAQFENTHAQCKIGLHIPTLYSISKTGQCHLPIGRHIAWCRRLFNFRIPWSLENPPRHNDIIIDDQIDVNNDSRVLDHVKGSRWHGQIVLTLSYRDS